YRARTGRVSVLCCPWVTSCCCASRAIRSAPWRLSSGKPAPDPGVDPGGSYSWNWASIGQYAGVIASGRAADGDTGADQGNQSVTQGETVQALAATGSSGVSEGQQSSRDTEGARQTGNGHEQQRAMRPAPPWRTS